MSLLPRLAARPPRGRRWLPLVGLGGAASFAAQNLDIGAFVAIAKDTV